MTDLRERSTSEAPASPSRPVGDSSSKALDLVAAVLGIAFAVFVVFLIGAGLGYLVSPMKALNDFMDNFIKPVAMVLWIIIGVGGALLLFWTLNRIAEMLPEKGETAIKPYLYIGPAFLAILVYLVYPAILSVINSFKDNFSQNWVGLKNYRELLGSGDFRQTLLNTLLWIIIVPAITVAVGLLIAVLSDRLQPRGEKLTKTIIFLPMAISLIGAATVWRFVYAANPKGEAQIGLFNAVIGKFGANPINWLGSSTFHFNSLLLMVILLWSQVGFSMVLLSAAVKGVPADTLEAARIDGAADRQIFFQVVLPQIKGTVITVFITVTIGVMKIFDIVYVNTNGNFNTNVLGNEFFNQISTFINYGQASAIVVILMIAVLPIMIYQVRNFKAEEANA